MGTGRGQDGPRELLARFLEQLSEAGEDELYLSPADAESLRAAACGGLREPRVARAEAPRTPTPAAVSRRQGGPGATSTTPFAARASRARKDTPRAAAGASGGGDAKSASRRPEPAEKPPEPEIVEVDLAICRSSPNRDMFAAATPVETCATLDEVEAVACGCDFCELAKTRTKVVFGAGNPEADLMFVGEAPGRDEDLSGIPFVGRAGKLLDKILEAAEIDREDVYIGNIIKCRPPNNRTPLTSEIEACAPYLKRQLEFIRPKIICTLGLPATQTLLGIRGSMGGLRGKVYRDRDIRVIPTYHPAAALRDPKYKRPLWEDFLIIRRELERV